MQDMNRVMILILLIGLLYALYSYQQSINASTTQSTSAKKIKKPIKKLVKKPIKQIKSPVKQPVANDEQMEQIEIESEEDLGSGYKQDSVMGDSLASGSLSFLDDKSNTDSLFF